MKTNFISLVFFLCASTRLFSQDMTDAMRYAQDNVNGTARFNAMGGAFGALGGDFSAININPAGSIVFSNSQIAVSLSSNTIKNKSNYFGTSTTENNFTFDLNQLGGVFVFNNEDKKSDWKKFSLALNYENRNNFDNQVFTSGTNPNQSIADYFLFYANANGGIFLNNLELQTGESISDLYGYLGSNLGYGAQQAFLGYQAYVIDPATDYDDNSNRNYVSLVPTGGNYYQENYFESTGYNGKLSFNAATQYKDQLYLGATINSHFSDYKQTTSFYENNSNDLTNGIQRLRFDNELYTYGTGISFQIGAIAKINKEIRLGLAYESPTWYELNDELSQRLRAVSADAIGELPTDDINPNVINIYETYQLQTPSKWTGSFAYIFGKNGLVSIDYSLKDYSTTQFEPNSDFRTVNSEMRSALTQSGELRIGAEYRVKEWSLRGGYRMEQSPYQNQKTVGDLSTFSSGFGYNFGTTRLDVSYTFWKRNSENQFFSQGFTDSTKVNSRNNSVAVTLVFEL